MRTANRAGFFERLQGTVRRALAKQPPEILIGHFGTFLELASFRMGKGQPFPDGQGVLIGRLRCRETVQSLQHGAPSMSIPG